MNMNMSVMTAMVNGQSNVKMTSIANAMTSSQDTSNASNVPGGFLGLIQELMANVATNESEIDGKQSETEQTEAYLGFLKKLEEVDLTKIDASWFQSVVSVIWPLVNEASFEQSDALAVIESLVASKQPVMSQFPVLTGNELYDDIQEFLMNQGVSSIEANQIVEQLMNIEDSNIAEKPILNSNHISESVSLASMQIQSKSESERPMVVEVIKQNESEAIQAMDRLTIVRPAVLQVSQTDIETMTKASTINQKTVTQLEDEEFSKFVESGLVEIVPKPAVIAHNGVQHETDDIALKQDVVDQVQSRVALNLKEGNDEFVMKLRPEGLGEITVKMVMQEGGKIVVNIQTQSQEAKAILSQEMNQLKSSLLAYNTEVGEITSYVSNEGFYQQSAYQHGSQQQPQFHRSAKVGYNYFQQEEVLLEPQQEAAMRTGKLLTYA